jgi:hypothetical protein
MDNQAYHDGYMCKDALFAEGAKAFGAGLGGAMKGLGTFAAGAIDTVADTATELLPYAVAMPFVFGLAGGYGHSALTRPTPEDIETTQKAMTSAELDEMLTNLRRQKAQSIKKANKGIANERTLHI